MTKESKTEKSDIIFYFKAPKFTNKTQISKFCYKKKILFRNLWLHEYYLRIL